MEPIRQALENSRLELLDMGLRGNSLLHFRAGAKTVEVVDERTAETLRLLVEEKRSLSFAPLPAKLADDAKPLEMSELVEKLAELQGDKRHQDNRLQTRLTAEQLDKRLLKIHTEALTYIQEQGVNTLYLALGFLTWCEAGNPDTPRKAPLLLVPVSLLRTSVRERFALRYTEAELGRNLTLAAKLKMEFQIELPDFNEETSLQEYWQTLRDQIAGKTGWSLAPDDIALGFFSFGKFQMYQDLAAEVWPEHKKPAAHPTLQSLLGDGFTSLNSLQNNPQALDLSSLNFVKDADSSQASAVLAVKSGGHLVIQGPPGTGKSQTITNIIADCLADGKTVLFVAEKMAALDVVKRRLDECHLGAAVLALHSHKTNKRSVLEDLQTTLELGAPVVGDHSAAQQRHRQLQQQLDRYCAAVNTPILHSNLSFIDILGLLQKTARALGDTEPLNLESSAWTQWTEAEFHQLDRNLGELATHIAAMGTPAQHPFAGAGLQDCSPKEVEQLRVHLTHLDRVLNLATADADTLARALSTAAPQTVEELTALAQAADLLITRPPVHGLNASSPEWHSQRSLLKELLAGRDERLEIRRCRASELLDQGWQVDMLETRRVWATLGKRWWRVLASDFRRARRTLQGILKIPVPADHASCLALLDDILRVQALEQAEARHKELIQNLFGGRWQAEGDLRRQAEWLMQLHAENTLTAKTVLLHLDKNDVPINASQLQQMQANLTELQTGLAQLNTLLALRQDPVQQPLAELRQQHADLPQHLERLYEMARYNRLLANLTQPGLEPMLQAAYNGEIPPAQLQLHLRLNWYRALLTHAYSQAEPLRFFDRQQHESAIQEFRQLDVALFRQTQERLVAQHFQQLPSGGAGEMEVLRREMNKKRRHLPIRQLLAQAGRAVQTIKPVFMMSPMSVATYLQPGDLEFDLVIFDEASQVRVVDAFGPLLRARQAVVVGDTRQMPPTDFFNKSLELDDEEAENSSTADIESILSMFLAKGAPEAWLRWHYRSRHESLIQVSNREFYDNKLFIFPSPGLNPQARGLLFHHLPETVYERGSTRTNPGEARAVARAVMRHAQETPNLTLGVVAFSTAQRDCILQELEVLRQEDSTCEAFFDENQLEGFFVKNLENVQGDERDVIMISIGYGRTAEGNLSRNFGPLNSEGGQRRLNVLITRARLAMEVFCNFTAGELAVAADTPVGVRALREFLHYAAHREQAAQQDGTASADHFVEAITQLLENEGYKVRAQLGAAGFFLDIALADPEQSGCYRLAVECDGANYHRISNTRDRDRLRQQVLEGLGWDFYRIWSVDWYRQPQQEVRRLLDRIAQAMSRHPAPAKPAPGAPKSAPVEILRNDARAIDEDAPPYRIFTGKLGITENTDLARLTPAKTALMLQKILAWEGALHMREAARRIADTAGGIRLTNRLLEQIATAAEEGHRQGLFYLHGEFLYPDAGRQVSPRDRSALPAASRQWELVPPEEWQAAVLQIVANAFSVSREDLVSHTLALLGFTRPSAQIKDQLHNTVAQLIEQKILTEQSDRVTRA